MDSNIYRRAECFLPWNLQKSIFNSTIFPYWSRKALYYFQQTHSGKSLVRVDIHTGKKEKILDYECVINALFLQLKQKIHHEYLFLDKFSLHENPLQLCFTYLQNSWCYDLEKKILTQKIAVNCNKLKSPDKNWELSIKNHDLFVTDLTSDQHFQLTTDGEPYYDYASSPETNTWTVTQRIAGVRSAPIAIWSPNSRKLVTHKLDQRKVDSLFLVQNAPSDTQRPKLHTYRMSFSGDENVPLVELIVIDIFTKETIPIKVEPLLSPYLTPLEFNWVWWGNDSQKLYFLRELRASKELMLCVADANTGETKILIKENAETYIEPSQLAPWPHQVIILDDSQEIIWLSERSGYAHLYLYDAEKNVYKNAITQGEWCVREVHFYDTESEWLYFTACGYNKNIDPYYKQFFRCRLDGSKIECLTEEHANHSISVSPDKSCFLDTHSTINTAPVSHLKLLDGKILCHIETADIQGLLKLNCFLPERFCVNARDGVTPIYGNLYFPSTFDPNKQYPIIDHIYPGPQFYRSTPHFCLFGSIFRSAWTAQALAELGFIVMHLDGFGTPGRSKAFHHATYGNISDCGIEDHVVAIKQLAKKYSYINLEKIGIYGYSGGGYAAVRAMLMYPDFYKVGVAGAGNHDLRCYPASYGEKYNGLDIATYSYQSNTEFAKNLRGKLLLVHGEMDDNVHPCATMQLVDALIKHNKNFDMLIMPNQNHRSTFDHPYYVRRVWDYFVRHLLNMNPPNYLIKPMPEEFPQLIDW